MTIIQVRPDTASVDFHMQVLGNKLREHRATALAELVEPKHVGAVRHAQAKGPERRTGTFPGSPLTSSACTEAGYLGHDMTAKMRVELLGRY